MLQEKQNEAVRRQQALQEQQHEEEEDEEEEDDDAGADTELRRCLLITIRSKSTSPKAFSIYTPSKQTILSEALRVPEHE